MTAPQGWFPDVNRTILAGLIERHRVRTVIEVGAFVGLATCWFAQRVDTVWAVDRFDAEVTCADYLTTDALREAAADQYATFCRNTAGHGNVKTVVGDSLWAARLPIDADLVYIDASHRYQDVKADIAAWAPHARAVLCGDDNTRAWPGVRRAVAELEGADRSGRVWFKEMR